jgi:exopolysaccharide transport family protein
MTAQRNIPRVPVLSLERAEEAPPQTEGGFDFNSVLQIIAVRYRLILGVALAVVALTLVEVSNMPAQYDAKALVLLDQRQNKVQDVNAVLSGLNTDQTSIGNQLQILRSRDLIAQVIDKLGLDKQVAPAPAAKPTLVSQAMHLVNPRNWFGQANVTSPALSPSAQRREALINAILGGESVTVLELSSALQITYRSSDPKQAAQIANAIADAYVQDQINAKTQATQKTSQWLADRLQELSGQMQTGDAAVQEYKADNNINETQGGGSVLEQQLGQLNAQLVAARSDAAEAQAKYNQAKQLQVTGKAEDLSQIFQAGMISQLRSQQAELLRQKAQYLTTFGPKHPKMLDLESQLRDVNNKIGEEVNRVVATVANDVVVANARVQSLQASLTRLEGDSGVENKAKVKLTELEARANSAHQLYQAFLDKFKETQGQEGIESADSRVISRAVVPGSPSAPDKMRDFEMAVAGGLFLGFLLAVGAERLDNRLRTAEQLEKLINLPVLCTVPELKGSSRRSQAADRIIEKPLSSFAEALRGLHLAIAHSNIDKKPRTILITSSVPDEGKTTVALSLARVAARGNKRVLLIDCDFRRPSIRGALGLRNPVGGIGTGIGKGPADHPNGLLDVLAGEKPLEESLVQDPRSPVQCLLASRIPGNPTDVLGSFAMERLLAKVKAEFDVVILDSAPLLPVNDTKILARLVDAIAFVVRWEKTPREAVATAARSLADIDAPVAGAVLTRADMRRYRYYGHGYQSYYSYDKYYSD